MLCLREEESPSLRRVEPHDRTSVKRLVVAVGLNPGSCIANRALEAGLEKYLLSNGYDVAVFNAKKREGDFVELTKDILAAFLPFSLSSFLQVRSSMLSTTFTRDTLHRSSSLIF
jgi:hypothetical protein